MPEAFDKPLIAARRPPPIPAWTRLGRIIAKLHAACVVYRYWQGREGRRELAGSGRLQVEIAEAQLRCRVLGDLFKLGPCEFGFHQFWLTRRGMIMAVFDLAESRPPESRAATEPFFYFANTPDPEVQREAAAFRDRPWSGKKRRPS